MAIKDASHVFGWANMWKPLNGLRPHFACELFGSGSHGFCVCFGEAKQDGRHRWETQFSSREHLGFSGGNSPPKHIYSLVGCCRCQQPQFSERRHRPGRKNNTKFTQKRPEPTEGFEPLFSARPLASKLPRMKRNSDLMLQDQFIVYCVVPEKMKN